MNKHDIAELVPMSIRTMITYLNYLHKQRRIYVARWEKEIIGRERRYPTELWAWGRGEDAEKPANDTKREIKKRAWQRTKADADRLDAVHKARAIRTMLANPKRVAAAAWIFGGGV